MPLDDGFTINRDTLENVRSGLGKHFAEVGLTEDELTKILPTNDNLTQIFTDKNLIRENVYRFLEKYYKLHLEISDKSKLRTFQHFIK